MTGDPAQTFRQEARELLDQLEQVLLDLAQHPDQQHLVDTAFRALHTIKGSGAMFGFDAVAAFVHEFETAFDKVRKGRIAPSSALVTVALAARDHIHRLIETGEEEGGAEILAELQRIVEPDGAPTADAAMPAETAAADTAATTWRVRFRLPPDALVSGANPLLLLDEIRELGPCQVTALTDAVPALDVLDTEICYLAWNVVVTTDRPREAIDDVFMFLRDDMELDVQPVDTTAKLGEILVQRGDVKPEAVAQALSKQPRLGDLLVDAGVVTSDQVNAALAEQQHVKKQSVRESAEQTNAAAKANASVRVPAERLDELMDRVGELVIAQARLNQIASASSDTGLKTIAEELERLSSGLRDTTMGIRMVPIGTIFGRFRRLIHDLARDLKKEIEFVTTGEETELDKTVIERLADPLVHMIRNSVDHGIEAPAERVAAGKPAKGTVRLSAFHAGGEVAIAIVDDGAGLNAARIRAKAEEAGLIAPDAKISDGELYHFLFHPGFSTAREVTALSGRGVGMDVVKRTIESLRGTIDITTEPGKGTTTTLRLPLTMAIIDGMLVRVGEGRYTIPLSAVEECVELPIVDAQYDGRSFLNIRGSLVPFLSLRELFKTTSPEDPYPKVVIVSSGEFRVGLVVDQIVGNYQVVIKSLSKLHASVQCFSGATILGDGSVALILDIPHLVSFGQAFEERQRGRAAA
jgi:two-component system, chemotaxis family, sensor kinase CheA